jgi:hypothetical protein
VERRTLLLIGFLFVGGARVSLAADSPIDTALRAIKMTERDLAFSKTNVESELILPAARQFLQQPRALPEFADKTLAGLCAVNSLDTLASFAVTLSEAKSPSRPIEILRSAQNDNWSGLPPRVADAVQLITDAARQIQPLLPKPDKAAFDAFVLDAFHGDRAEMGVDPELLRRDDALELQDTELADRILNASDHFDRAGLMTAFRTLVAAVDEAIAVLRTNHIAGEFQAETDTEFGKIVVAGAGAHVFTNEAFLIIGLGGDNVYSNSAGGADGLDGRPISIVIDLGNHSRFVSNRSFSQGAGVFGIGILAALGSNCTFQAKHLSQGAGFFGCGLLMTGEGEQDFEADTFCQGAGMFGAGILWQRGGNTTYRAAQMAQGFGGTQAVGLLLDEAGNDSYFVGGKYPCDWLPGHHFSLAQGFGYGMRPFAGGGLGILCDLKGDDHYVADVYGQGASYWYSVGLLLDAEGDDRYDAYQYCQGAGIHLSNGALIDWAGNDTYTAGHICQGAAHDYAVGTLIDRAGNDKYTGDTTAQGAAINNSFAMLLDVAGNDRYTGIDPKQSQAAGHDGGKREYGSVALLLDLGGHDTYSQGQTNNTVWLKPWYGAGLDAEIAEPTLRWPNPLTVAGGGPVLQTNRLYQIAPVDPHQPIEHLLRVAISDQPDADKAWDEIKQLGTNALAYLVTRLDSPNVLVRAKTEELVDHLGTNSIPALITGIDTAKNDEIARLCCYFLARFDEKARSAIPHVLPLLQRDITRPIAFYTLGHLRAREAFAPALRALYERELVRLRAVQALGKIGDHRATASIIRKLDDELYDVRYAAEDALVGFGKPSIRPLRDAYAKASTRARPHIIAALARLGDRRALSFATQEYRHDDPLVRAAVMQSLKVKLAGAK